jgi:hypothetical protein
LYPVAPPEDRSNRGFQYLTTFDGLFSEKQLYIPLGHLDTAEARVA